MESLGWIWKNLMRCIYWLTLTGVLVASLACACSTEKPAPVDVNAPMESNDIGDTSTIPEPNRAPTLAEILNHTQAAAESLNSLQGRVVYTFVDTFNESTTTRLGQVHYRRLGTRSDLRIQFTAKKEDEMPEVRYREEMFFDGVWSTHIDYQGRMVKKQQLVPADQPMDALDLVSRDVPIFGFNGLKRLRERYHIETIPAEPNAPTRVHLRFMPDPSTRSDDTYQRMDMWLDSRHWLPTHVEAVNQNEDVFDLRFPDLQIDQPIDPNVFNIQIPANFGSPEVVPLP